MLTASFLGMALLMQAGAAIQKNPDVFDAMAGEWVVDLSVSSSEPYTQPMIVKINADRSITGEFYNSVIEQGRAGRNQGRTCMSFQTSDGAGPYHHAACLVDDTIVGQSWAEHRKFILPWTARRKQAE